MKIRSISFLLLFSYVLFFINTPSKILALEAYNLLISESLIIPISQNHSRIKSFDQKDNYSFKCSTSEEFSKALMQYQSERIDQAEYAFRNLIKKYPMCADTRAAITAILWRKRLLGEAQSNWTAVIGLDNRYSNKEWLLNILDWPQKPTQDLLAFLDWLK